MSFGQVNEVNLARIPLVDSFCGTAGENTDLNALVAAGKTRILCGPGAVLTANLTLTGSSGFIVSLFGARALNLGAYTITVDGATWHLEGLSVMSAAGAGFVFASNANGCSLVRCAAQSCGSHGIHVNTSFNDHVIQGCYFLSNGGDGIRMESGANVCRVIGNFSYGNTGYGINDLSNSAIAVANRIDGNTAGALNGTPAIDVGNKKT